VIEKIELENIKIFFSNTPPQVNLRRSLDENGLECRFVDEDSPVAKVLRVSRYARYFVYFRIS